MFPATDPISPRLTSDTVEDGLTAPNIPHGWSSVTEDGGTGGWGDPNHPGWNHSPHLNSAHLLPEPHQISLPETTSVLADLRKDFTIENLLWSGQEWRHPHMDHLDSPAWARIQRKL